MASNDDSSRRDGRRPEDNPFIAFRRFADSQASSLFDTLVGLPAMLARFNDAEHAREQCLFGQADKKKCDELQKLTEQMGEQAFKSVGDLPQLLQSRDSEALKKRLAEFTKLEQEIDKVTQEIVEAGRGQERARHAGRTQAELIERVGNRKGQQWGWSWDWGFPRPFDEEERSKVEDKTDYRRYGTLHDPKYSEHRPCRRWQRRRERHAAQQAQDEENQGRGVSDSMPSKGEELRRPVAAVNDTDRAASVAATLAVALEQLSKPLWDQSHIDRPDPYSPKSLEEDELFGKAGIRWRDAWEDLVRTMGARELITEEKPGESRKLSDERQVERMPEVFRSPFHFVPDYPRVDPWSGTIGQNGHNGEHPHGSSGMSGVEVTGEPRDEPSYEYGHDHEDQHDDPPTPKPKQGRWSSGAPATELEAYEKLLGTSSSGAAAGIRPSVLSTLTTTERTTAPDGTVTTKVVLKKRFADGREESSETVHTQKGQESNAAPQQDAWKAMQDAQFPSQLAPASGKEEKKDDKKKGWFWTG
ncbi:hypothetical protein BDV96DRAFT_577903 [Lophiotrema nucula]|uniref:Uncharacterized protein n=1 Tax=Lophiotrema nucula TaxID=690887 RepID=A0A6A5Z353_9PLEO|nr:hypothetical protein BDV96DRAFT_577903 [Lophiotrema nucula]